MLLHNGKSTAGIKDGKHLPLLIQVHPAGQVYAETAALKQQKRPTKTKKKEERNTWTNNTKLAYFSGKSIIMWQDTQILHDLRFQCLQNVSPLKWKPSSIKKVIPWTDKSVRFLFSLSFKASNLLITDKWMHSLQKKSITVTYISWFYSLLDNSNSLRLSL